MGKEKRVGNRTKATKLRRRGAEQKKLKSKNDRQKTKLNKNRNKKINPNTDVYGSDPGVTGQKKFAKKPERGRSRLRRTNKKTLKRKLATAKELILNEVEDKSTATEKRSRSRSRNRSRSNSRRKRTPSKKHVKVIGNDPSPKLPPIPLAHPMPITCISSFYGDSRYLRQLLRSAFEAVDRVFLETPWGKYIILREKCTFLCVYHVFDGCLCNPMRFRYFDLRGDKSDFLHFVGMNSLLRWIVKANGQFPVKPSLIRICCNRAL